MARAAKPGGTVRLRRGGSVEAGEESLEPSPGAAPRTLNVRVVWSDLEFVQADVLLVGHYVGVMPQRAELAADRIISGHKDKKRKLIVTELTRRGALRGELGEVILFPGPEGGLVALGGMGRPGTFRSAQARILARNVAQVVGLLPKHNELATVLIGSGKGNLPVKEAVAALLGGLADALQADPHLVLERLQIVEQRLDRALEIQEEVEAAQRDAKPRNGGVVVRCEDEIVDGTGGDIPNEFSCAMILAALARGTGQSELVDTHAFVEQALAELPIEVRNTVRAYLQREIGEQSKAHKSTLRKIAMRFRLRDPDEREGGKTELSSRVAFWRSADDVLAAAITNLSTVAERAIPKRAPLVDIASEKLQLPDEKSWERDANALHRLLLHPDLNAVWEGNGEPLVLELDRSLARVQWEMLPHAPGVPIGVARRVARQLRTFYSPKPVDTAPPAAMQALVIGDPGGADASLPAAREEAQAVARILEEKGINTTLLVGPRDPGTRAGVVKGVPPADFFDAVVHLMSGAFDIVHYCGHAVFDPAVPSRTGWWFEGGLLTGAELQGMLRSPRLVFANACLSSQLSDHAVLPRGDSRLVAGLADEFFKYGVFDYIGTAWEVESNPAIEFAQMFYKTLLAGNGASLGEAMQAARGMLYERREELGMAWGAYQHYGDPTRRVKPHRGQGD